MRNLVLVTVMSLFVLLASAPGMQARAAEQGVLQGWVLDAQSGGGIGGATVVIEETGIVRDTDAQGRFEFAGLPPGVYTLTVRWIGAGRHSETVTLPPDDGLEVRIALTPEFVTFEEILVEADALHIHPHSVIDSAKLKETRPRDVGELFRSVPGMSAVRRGGTNLDPVYRGCRNEQLNVQIDGGAHVCGACPNRMDPPSSHVQAEDLQSVEIIKGPSAMRYGPIYGGLINLVLGPPQTFESFQLHGSVESRYTGNSEGTQNRLTLWAGDGPYALYLSGGLKEFGDYTDGDGRTVPAGARVYDYSVKAALKRGSSDRLQLTARQSFQRDVIFSALPMDADLDDTAIFALDYSNQASRGWYHGFTAKAYLSTVHHVMDNSAKPTYAMLHARTVADTRTGGGRLELASRSGGGLLYGGLDLSRVTMDGDRTREFVAGPNQGKRFKDVIWPDAAVDDLGAFLQFERSLTGNLLASAGTRFDRVTASAGRPDAAFTALHGEGIDDTDANASASLSLTYNQSARNTFNASVGRSARSASIWERYLFLLSVGVDRYDYVGDPDLEPEKLTQAEVGYRMDGGSAQLEVSLHYSWISDVITARVDPSLAPRSAGVRGVKRYVNVDRARKYGYEAQSKLSLSSSWSLGLSVSQVIGDDLELDEPLPEMPPLEGRLSLRFEPPGKRLWTEASYRAADRQTRISREFGESETPGFAVLDLSAGWKVTRHFEVSAGVNNLFDKAYYEHLNRMRSDTGESLREMGRSVSVGLRATI